MLKVLLWLYLAVCILFATAMVIAASKVYYVFKTLHPNFKFKKSHWTDSAISFIQLIFLVGCPILNNLFFGVILFNYNDFCEKAVNKLEEVMAEQEQRSTEH